jgi:hypothetical protein
MYYTVGRTASEIDYTRDSDKNTDRPDNEERAGTKDSILSPLHQLILTNCPNC